MSASSWAQCRFDAKKYLPQSWSGVVQQTPVMTESGGPSGTSTNSQLLSRIIGLREYVRVGDGKVRERMG